ncbi:MAG: aspartate/tyrosine/aromatic aminotransferase [Magnetovibrio sp.]|nr:aspartate/tyrosine/aromatic aminotransferase [Magnetovibrio sp.]
MFEKFAQLPADPILGLMAAFRTDTNPHKVDLGVGVYKDPTGNTPVLSAVKLAEQVCLDEETTKAYIGPAGDAGFNDAMTTVVFGAEALATQDDRIRTVQTPGGCGALRMAGELIKRALPNATMWVSDPTWAYHTPLFEGAGLTLKTYPYFDAQNGTVRFDDMMECLNQVKAGDVVLFHGCCHNPTGVDLSNAQWDEVVQLATKSEFLPFVDLAYQGFGDGLNEDAYGVRALAAQVPEMIVAVSCSKNFGLYRERTGAVMLVSPSSESANAALSQQLNIIRGNYSMPPAHGAAIVRIILADPKLREDWQTELKLMRDRIRDLRVLFADKMQQRGVERDFSFITRQKGMFSFLGISEQQVERLRTEYSIYIAPPSRINIAGINDANVDYLADAIASVL